MERVYNSRKYRFHVVADMGGWQVPSSALQDWLGPRAAHLDEILVAHRLLGGVGPGRRFNTQAANWALILLLSAEFQGFVKDLHYEASEALAAYIANGDVTKLTLVRNNMTAGREIDRVNAKPDSVRKDFERLGVTTLWQQVRSAVSSGAKWKSCLEDLNEARNGVAHNDLKKLAKLKAEGVTLNLRTIKTWRSACNGVARQFDKIVGAAVQGTTGTPPW